MCWCPLMALMIMLPDWTLEDWLGTSMRIFWTLVNWLHVPTWSKLVTVLPDVYLLTGRPRKGWLLKKAIKEG